MLEFLLRSMTKRCSEQVSAPGDPEAADTRPAIARIRARLAFTATPILIFVQVLLRDVVFGDLAGPDATLVGVGGVLDSADDAGLEGLPFLDQFLDALGVGHLVPGKPLDVAGLPGGVGTQAAVRVFVETIRSFPGHGDPHSALTSGTSTRCSETNQTCFSLVRITSEMRRSLVPSSPASAACRAMERASSRMISWA